MSTMRNAQSHGPSHLFIKISLGGICIVFLIVLIFGRMIFDGQGFGILDSISDYNYSDAMRNFFVGGLCALAILLMCYRYQRVDTYAAIFAGICAIGVALFPEAPPQWYLDKVGATVTKPPPWIGNAHWAFAGLFLLTIAYMVFFRFTKKSKNPTRRKHHRNWVYWLCGSLMFAIIGGCFLVQKFFLSQNPWLQSDHPVFWFETSALVLFIVAWFVKGEVLLKDKDTGLSSLSGVITFFRTISSDKVSPSENDPKYSPSNMPEKELTDASHLTPESSFGDQNA